jgi:hypothetical protein
MGIKRIFPAEFVDISREIKYGAEKMFDMRGLRPWSL